MFAQADECALITPADAAPILGGEKKAHTLGPGVGCTWGGAGSGGVNNHSVMILTPQETASPAGKRFASDERNALAHPEKARLEHGLGDKAYSQLASYGVKIVILKGGRILQLQFVTGKPGTAEQLVLLREVAKKAAARF